MGHDDASEAHRHCEDSDASHVAHITLHHDHETGGLNITHHKTDDATAQASDMEDGGADDGKLIVEKTLATRFREARNASRAELDPETLCFDQCVVMRIHGGGKKQDPRGGCPLRKAVLHEPETRRWAAEST